MTADLYLRQGWQRIRGMAANPRFRKIARVVIWAGAGFFLSAASLGESPQPFAMALAAAMTGWRSVILALGSGMGYVYFWGGQGFRGVVWSVMGALTALFLGKRKAAEEVPLLIPAACALWVAATGLTFLLAGFGGDVGSYLLQVLLAPAASWLFLQVRQRKDLMPDWLAEGVAVLALARVAPGSWLNPGCIAAGALSLTEAFPAAALAGLALDLAGTSRVSMTGVLCVLWLSRLIPGIPAWGRRLMPGAAYLAVLGLCGVQDLRPLAGLVLGGVLSVCLPRRQDIPLRRGETGIAQVRLELMAGVLSQTQQLLQETREVPIDEEALMCRTRERACGGCPNRKACHFSGPLSGDLLHRPLVDNTSLPFSCKKPGRMVLELRRTQEQYRNLRADRERRREYRSAVVQQYQFLSEYLREQADLLPRRGEVQEDRFRPEVGVSTLGREADNGDRLRCFRGTGGSYYVLLCDGMGTGILAAQEGKSAAQLLRDMLTAGFPAAYALRSLNSMLALRGRAGAVTVDLAELCLVTGKATLYKWGAAPSYLLRGGGAEKIGTAGPPPGLSASDIRETVERLSLRRGEVLILASDGVDGEEFRRWGIDPGEPPGELAAKLLELGAADTADDATAAVIRLHPTRLST